MRQPHHLFDRALAGEIKADTAVLFGDGQTKESEVACLLMKISGDRVACFDFHRARINFFGKKTTEFVAQRLHFRF